MIFAGGASRSVDAGAAAVPMSLSSRPFVLGGDAAEAETSHPTKRHCHIKQVEAVFGSQQG
jgi:hypothetical protein